MATTYNQDRVEVATQEACILTNNTERIQSALLLLRVIYEVEIQTDGWGHEAFEKTNIPTIGIEGGHMLPNTDILEALRQSPLHYIAFAVLEETGEYSDLLKRVEASELFTQPISAKSAATPILYGTSGSEINIKEIAQLHNALRTLESNPDSDQSVIGLHFIDTCSHPIFNTLRMEARQLFRIYKQKHPTDTITTEESIYDQFKDVFRANPTFHSFDTPFSVASGYDSFSNEFKSHLTSLHEMVLQSTSTDTDRFNLPGCYLPAPDPQALFEFYKKIGFDNDASVMFFIAAQKLLSVNPNATFADFMIVQETLIYYLLQKRANALCTCPLIASFSWQNIIESDAQTRLLHVKDLSDAILQAFPDGGQTMNIVLPQRRQGEDGEVRIQEGHIVVSQDKTEIVDTDNEDLFAKNLDSILELPLNKYPFGNNSGKGYYVILALIAAANPGKFGFLADNYELSAPMHYLRKVQNAHPNFFPVLALRGWVTQQRESNLGESLGTAVACLQDRAAVMQLFTDYLESSPLGMSNTIVSTDGNVYSYTIHDLRTMRSIIQTLGISPLKKQVRDLTTFDNLPQLYDHLSAILSILNEDSTDESKLAAIQNLLTPDQIHLLPILEQAIDIINTNATLNEEEDRLAAIIAARVQELLEDRDFFISILRKVATKLSLSYAAQALLNKTEPLSTDEIVVLQRAIFTAQTFVALEDNPSTSRKKKDLGLKVTYRQARDQFTEKLRRESLAAANAENRDQLNALMTKRKELQRRDPQKVNQRGLVQLGALLLLHMVKKHHS